MDPTIHIYHERPSFFAPLIISVALHALILILSLLIPAALPQEPKQTVIEVWPTAPAEIEKMVQKEQKMPLRIADIDPPAVQKRPKKARFAGMYDSSVEEETVATGRGRGGGKGSGKGGRGKKSKASGKGRDKIFKVDENLFAMREPAREMEKKKSTPLKGGGGRVSIGGGGGDFFPDVKIGGHTYLNVLRYPEVSYFVRLKRAFRMTFNPVPSLKNYFSNNRVARGSVDVVMAVSVDGTGRLSELFVLRSSGIPGYDHEALRTVRASAPFSKPPDKFLANDGQLRMMWTFSVYL
jgi:TonB family protein